MTEEYTNVYDTIVVLAPQIKDTITRIGPSALEGDIPFEVAMEMMRDAARVLHETDKNGLYCALFKLPMEEITTVKFQPNK